MLTARLRRRTGSRTGAAATTCSPAPTPDVLCRAPWTSMYLDPTGEVKACCQNEWLRLGNIGEATLGDIWRGAPLRRLRERVEAGRLDLGCDMCELAVSRGAPGSAFFNEFAALPLPGTGSDWPVRLELALSNTCSLQCVMCNGELSSAIRARREHRAPLVSPYGQRFFGELDEFLPHLGSVTFLGGEPFLARESLRVMDRLVELGLRPYCSVTTNGTQWNARIERLVRQLPMDVAVSLDGVSTELVRSIRVGIDHPAVLRNVQRLRRATAEGGGRLRFSFTLMTLNWRELVPFVRWADSQEVQVFVNTVHHPPHLSFAHCPLSMLDDVVAALDEEHGRHPTGGVNADVLAHQLQALRALARQRREVPATTSVGHSTAVPLPTRRPGGGRPARLIADRRQLITAVDPGDAALDGLLGVSTFVGRSLWECVAPISRALGVLERSNVRRTDRGGEERTMVFRSGADRVELRARLEMEGDTPTWELEVLRAGTAPGS